MGFLDKLVKKGVDSLIENVANTVTDAVNNAMGAHIQTMGQAM